jgi:hypothetical protein
MPTIKLLWGTTWRGGAFGLVAGTMGGAGYGAIFANVLFAFGLMSQAPFEFKPEYVVSGLVAVLFFAFIGSIAGALFGVPTGLVVGIADGMLLGVMTRALFYPLKNARRYRWMIAIVSAIFTGIVAWLCFISIMLFYVNRNAANVGVLAVIVTIPALIAGVGAGLTSRLVAHWYESESKKGVIQNV